MTSVRLFIIVVLLLLVMLILCAYVDVFRVDPNYEENEKAYTEIRKEILGDDEEEAADNGDGDTGAKEAHEGDEGMMVPETKG